MGESSSNRHHPLRLADQGLPPVAQLLRTEGMSADEETRDWAELPLDALLAVLRRLDVVDILMGAGHVCRPWRRVTREEPDLWRHIDIRVIRHHAKLANAGVDLQPAVEAAVRRSEGRCEAFSAQGLRLDSDRFFLFLAGAAPQLKSLGLISWHRISKHGLNEGIRKYHMLEELELSLLSDSTNISCFFNLAETCNAAAEACPRLKRLRLNKYRFQWQSRVGDSEATEISKMRGLQLLQLFGNSLGNAGLSAILQGCVHLESLDIRHCFNVKMNDEVRAQCTRLHTLRLPDDSVYGYDLNFGTPEMDPGSPVDRRNVRNPAVPYDDRTGNIGDDWYWR